jgi:hypothetical protein
MSYSSALSGLGSWYGDAWNATVKVGEGIVGAGKDVVNAASHAFVARGATGEDICEGLPFPERCRHQPTPEERVAEAERQAAEIEEQRKKQLLLKPFVLQGSKQSNLFKASKSFQSLIVAQDLKRRQDLCAASGMVYDKVSRKCREVGAPRSQQTYEGASSIYLILGGVAVFGVVAAVYHYSD